MEITASQCGDVTNLTCAISPPETDGEHQRAHYETNSTVTRRFLNKPQQISAATNPLYGSVLCVCGALFSAIVTTTLMVCGGS